MTDDPLSGVSSPAIAAAEGFKPLGLDAAEAAVDEVIAPLASPEHAFVSRTREAARRRGSTMRRSSGSVREIGADMAERGRRMLDDGLDGLPGSQELVGRGRSAVLERPTTALLIAGAVGFGLGWLIHKRDP